MPAKVATKKAGKKEIKEEAPVVPPVVETPVVEEKPAEEPVKEPKKPKKTAKKNPVEKKKKEEEKKDEKKEEKKPAKKSKGGKKKATKKKVAETKLSDEKRPRYFKLVYDGQTLGRFSGSKPKQAANKAFTSIVKGLEKNEKPFIDVGIRFCLKECTRWNKKKCKKGEDGESVSKPHEYVGIRKQLDTQVIVDHVQSFVDESAMKGGKITKEVPCGNGIKYYVEAKDKDTKKIITNIFKKINVCDKETKKPTGEVKFAVINEIKYKYQNKVQKFKAPKVEETK